MATRMLQRRGTASQWNSANPVLGEGEIGWESDTNKFKIGDGVNTWDDLSYFADTDTIGASIDDYVPLTAVGTTVAPIASPALTGTPTAPTATANTNTTQIATTAFVSTAISNLVGAAPEALNTLAELGDALNDDASFATTVTNSLSQKASLTGAETLTNKTLTSYTVAGQTKEQILTTATGFSGYTYNLTNGGVQYITANSTSNGTINFRGDMATTLNAFMSNGQSVTCVLLVTNGGTAYYPNAFQIDGNSIVPKWQGGVAPASGNTNSIDLYSFTIIKTDSNTYQLLASQTRFA